MKTRDQLRAERASALVGTMKADLIRDYASEIRLFPALVVDNGLGPALAFLRAKGGPAKNSLYEHLSNWLAEAIFAEPKGDALALLTKHSAAKLMRAHEETLAFAAWLRRFAEAREPKARKA